MSGLDTKAMPVADPGGGRGGHGPPGPVKIGHKKDGHRRRPHRFHVSRPPPYPAAGSATACTETFLEQMEGQQKDAISGKETEMKCLLS